MAAFGLDGVSIRGPKRPVAAKPMVAEFGRTLRDGSFLLQLPLYITSENANGSRGNKEREAASQIDVVMDALKLRARHLDRASITSFALCRIGPGVLDEHDNLRSAFKHICDATCCWICIGDRPTTNTIGIYDRHLSTTGKVTWTYAQRQHESNPDMNGIQIILTSG